MFALLFLGSVILVVYLLSKNNSSAPKKVDQNLYVTSVDDELNRRNSQWVAFIESYKKIATTASAKALMDRIMRDMDAQGLSGSAETQRQASAYNSEDTSQTQSDNTVALSSAQTRHSYVAETHKTSEQSKLDNVSLLLYFGAFLFVASVGLFIAFAGVSGLVRTCAVALLAIVMYIGGVWLFRHKRALQPAGLTFAGIGIAVTPLVGVAAYNFVLPNSPELVWFVTSVLCLGLYSHAIFALQRPLINYIFMFTILSMFESAVSIVEAPVYLFGWVMAFVGIVMLLASRMKGVMPGLQESSRASASLFVPLSIFVSLILIGSSGIGQLGVSLLLAAVFYGMEAIYAEAHERASLAVVSHIAGLIGVASLVFSATNSATQVAISLLIINLLHFGVILRSPGLQQVSRNIASVAMGALLVALLVGAGSAGVVCLVLMSAIVLAAATWLKQSRADAYALMMASWIVLPIVFGRAYLQPALSFSWTAVLMLGAWLIHAAVFIWKSSENTQQDITETGRAMLLLATAVTVFVSALAGSTVGLAISLALAISMLLLSEKDRAGAWQVSSGLTVIVPILLNIGRPGVLLSAMIIALLFNIGLALRYRSEFNRWLSTGLWLILPLGFGAGAAGSNWTATWYAWAYVLVTLALVLSRAIARDSVFLSKNIPLASYAKSASLSYVMGYSVAGILAILISLAAENSQFHSSLILALMSILAALVARYIERKNELYALQPLIWQALLLSVIRPAASEPLFGLYLILSSGLAASAYMAVRSQQTGKLDSAQLDFAQTSLVTALIAPAALFITGKNIWPMALGLFIFGCLLLDYVRRSTQKNRELAISVMLLALWWAMHIAGVTSLQAYTHVLAAMFAGFAYWRYRIGDTSTSDSYLVAMLATATIPLILQALGGQAGDLYGWWLLLEQVFFMLLGMIIGKGFVTRWGLYVAVGAVLYQLRHLGFAALAFLGLFIIGIAIYQLQKYNQNPPNQN